ncbi:peptidylprolyl isomerase [Moorena sp. SIO3H5]|uniref:peptidylprolyl isomerase n=1 Tax=Moorena sp. SIO3H5 TaxID=2607834 RepID=UPI0013B6CF04|nr:peptidylprolyl isomerase [Moorena sp. SIO3H5]NEO70609.1 peptidylprolyl isomerase [Moorena sp. SIO3H5]
MKDILQVGNQTITASEIIPLLRRYLLLPQLFREIIIDHGIAGISCTPEEETSAEERFYAKHKLTDDKACKAWCQNHQITLNQLKALATRELQIEKFQQETWGDRLESYFLERKQQLDQVSYSLIRVKHKGVARELYYRLEDGEQSFAEIARKYSQGPEAQSGGLIGLMPITMPHPQIARILKLSQPGQLWPPAQIGEWIVIVRLEKLIPAQLDQPMRQRLLKELFNRWLGEQLQQLIETGNREQGVGNREQGVGSRE